MINSLHADTVNKSFSRNHVVREQNVVQVLNYMLNVAHGMISHHILEPDYGTVATVIKRQVSHETLYTLLSTAQ